MNKDCTEKKVQYNDARDIVDASESSREMPLITYVGIFQVSQTITRGGPRTQIAIPAQGMIEFRDALTDLLEEFGTDDGGFKGDLPEGRYMRVDSKNFYFDIGQNNRGIYMRISEVRARCSFYPHFFLTLTSHLILYHCLILLMPISDSVNYL